MTWLNESNENSFRLFSYKCSSYDQNLKYHPMFWAGLSQGFTVKPIAEVLFLIAPWALGASILIGLQS